METTYLLVIDSKNLDYGNYTGRIEDILSFAKGDWSQLLRLGATNDPDSTTVQRCLDQLQALVPEVGLSHIGVTFTPSSWAIAFILQEFLHGDYKACQWRKVIADVTRKFEQNIIQSEEKRNLLRPPIWEFPGNVNVLNRLIASKRAIGQELSGSRAEAAWRLMCDVETYTYGAIVCALALDVESNANAFCSLLELCRSGMFPIGIFEEELFIFTPQRDLRQ